MNEEILERIRAIRRMIIASNPPDGIRRRVTVGIAPRPANSGRYFKRVKGRKSASLHERSRRRKVTR